MNKIIYQMIQNRQGIIQYYEGHDDDNQFLLILQSIPILLT